MKNVLNSWLTSNAALLMLTVVIIILTAVGIVVGVSTCRVSTSESQRAETRGMVAAFKEDLQHTYENLANQTANDYYSDLLATYNKAKDRYEAANRALDSLDYVEARNAIDDGVAYLKVIRTYWSSTISGNIRIIADLSYLSFDFDSGNATGITKEGELVTVITVTWGASALPLLCSKNIVASYSVYPEAVFDNPVTFTFNYLIPERFRGKKLVLITREESSGRWIVLDSQASRGSATATVYSLTGDYIILSPIPDYPRCLSYPTFSSCGCWHYFNP